LNAVSKSKAGKKLTADLRYYHYWYNLCALKTFNQPSMRLQLSPRFLLSFLFLFLLIHEAHEFSHHISGRLICGSWGTRDFLYFQTCDSAKEGIPFILFSLVGPFMNFLFMWTGFLLLRKQNSVQKKCWGFAFVMGALPLPILLAALKDRGGDVMIAFRKIFEGHESFKSEGVIAGCFVVVLLSIPPLWRAFKSIQNKNSLLIFLAFLVIPYLLDWLIVENLLNRHIYNNFLNTPVLFGTPFLIILWEIILLAGFLLTTKNIRLLAKQN
jgi:hypothetical protein